MSATQPVLQQQQSLKEISDSVCSAFAPSWPLDRSIAVNPFWGRVGESIEDVFRDVARSTGTPLWMSREFFLNAWKKGQFQAEDLQAALKESGRALRSEDLLKEVPSPQGEALLLPSDCIVREGFPSWSSIITHQVGQVCAACFDDHFADWSPYRGASLLESWFALSLNDRGLALLTGISDFRARFRELPRDALGLLDWSCRRLEIAEQELPVFLQTVLARIGGWATWCRYLEWQAALEGREESRLSELLAIRAAWEALIVDDVGSLKHWKKLWRKESAQSASRWHEEQALLQRALEHSYQRQLISELEKNQTRHVLSPEVQAVFCIDVRSEVIRRAVESVSLRVQTLGFAGFFGLPIAYSSLGAETSRPQLPGLLPASLEVRECGDEPGETARALKKRTHQLLWEKTREPFSRLPGSAFTLVESLGIGYLGKLLKRLLPSKDATPPLCCTLPPEFQRANELSLLIDLAERALRGMSLVKDFAPIVLLVGHGSHTTNNPQRAALDCGACCGQTGEVNARLLARTLNKREVRQGLQERGIHIPEKTLFVAALHSTTTDVVTLFDLERLPASEQARLAPVRTALQAAGDIARNERARRLQGMGAPARTSEGDFAIRANDWSETRPEWGLANNAAFIVAPRKRTAGLNLEGRAFLHEYEAALDHDGSILELIMTAPMLVTHWINMQYYASTVDNLHFGSGNKVLHNVVGGHLGVFEGNGGDLRVGLSLQSLHNGEEWMHTPLRLSVFIEAPKEALERVIAKHKIVRDLIENNWIYLFQIDTDGSSHRIGA